MKTCLNILVLVLLFCNHVTAQSDSIVIHKAHRPEQQLTIAPAIGIHTNFGTDFLMSNLVQWNLNKRLAVASYSSFNINNVTQRDFNFIKTDYNYSFNQKFGVGSTMYSKKNTHTFLVMMGMKYTTYQETLDNPNLEKVSTSIRAWSPDYGLMYSLKKDWKKYFFTYRFYLPLSPWLTHGANLENVQGTLRDIALEFGVGVKIN